MPLMYRPLEFYEFNASNWDNFPTEENPYAPPMWQGAGILWLLQDQAGGDLGSRQIRLDETVFGRMI